MSRQYEKECLGCHKKYWGTNTATCPECGSDRWIFVKESGAQFHPVKEIISARPEGFMRKEPPMNRRQRDAVAFKGRG